MSRSNNIEFLQEEIFPLYSIFRTGYQSNLVYFSNMDIHTCCLKFKLFSSKQMLVRSSGEKLNFWLYINFEEAGGEFFGEDTPYPLSFYHQLLENNIDIHSEVDDVIAITRQWTLNKIMA